MRLIVLNCAGDFDNDQDVDGLDHWEYAQDSGIFNLDVFVANFGKTIFQ